jgi:ubiquinone/menaquinone biosynthesis C-methylase UbiE
VGLSQTKAERSGARRPGQDAWIRAPGRSAAASEAAATARPISNQASGPPAPDFGPLAEDYDRLRPVDESWWELVDVLVADGDLRGRRVLDVGCGTGRLAAALAERGAKVWGVDSSPEMLAQAREVAGRSVGLKQGRAEALPFRDGWFDRAVMRLVVHLVDRSLALPELARVLAPGGRALIATFAPAHFEWYWLVKIFPAVAEIDRLRFPPPEVLAGELETAGFVSVSTRSLPQRRLLTREEALERIRGRYISTLRLLDEQTLAAGLERAERELPEEIEARLEWAIVSADLPGAQ